MTADELREKVAQMMYETAFDSIWSILPGNVKDTWRGTADAAIRVVIEAAADISESYEPRCDTCPRGVASAIRALLPEEQQ